MRGDHKMRLNGDGKTLRELFNVPENRCMFLCDLVDTIERSNPNWPISKVIEIASEQTESENENRFLIAQYFHDNGIDHGIEAGVNIGANAVAKAAGLFERAAKYQANGLRIRKEQMQ